MLYKIKVNEMAEKIEKVKKFLNEVEDLIENEFEKIDIILDEDEIEIDTGKEEYIIYVDYDTEDAHIRFKKYVKDECNGDFIRRNVFDERFYYDLMEKEVFNFFKGKFYQLYDELREKIIKFNTEKVRELLE